MLLKFSLPSQKHKLKCLIIQSNRRCYLSLTHALRERGKGEGSLLWYLVRWRGRQLIESQCALSCAAQVLCHTSVDARKSTKNPVSCNLVLKTGITVTYFLMPRQRWLGVVVCREEHKGLCA